MLTKLCRTETLLNALMVELDKYSCNSKGVSPRLNDWLSLYAQGTGSGEISASDTDFVHAFLAMQKEVNSVDLAKCGLADVAPAAHPKQHILIKELAQVTAALKEFSQKASEKGLKGEKCSVFEADVSRCSMFVNGVQISGNDNPEENDFDRMPTIAGYFANQSLFADALASLLTEKGITLAADTDNGTSIYSLNVNDDGSMELHAQLDKKPNVLLSIANDEMMYLDAELSSMHLEINLRINIKGKEVVAELSGPLTIDYRAVPLDEFSAL